jgi:hypothetical protein
MHRLPWNVLVQGPESRRQNERPYSAFAPEAFTTFAHFWMSART